MTKIEKIRKNTPPKWYNFKTSYCLSCGKSFTDNEAILSGKFCSECSEKKERDLKIDKQEVYYTSYHSVCVKCAKPFQKDDQTLFMIYCKTCGKKWEKERKLKQARLKKARGL